MDATTTAWALVESRAQRNGDDAESMRLLLKRGTHGGKNGVVVIA